MAWMVSPMVANGKKALWGVLVIPFIVLAAWLFWLYRSVNVTVDVYRPEPLRIIVADPTRNQAAADAIKGRVRRDYGPLAAFLEARLGRPVELLYSDDLRDTLEANSGNISLIIGKASVVSIEAAEANEPVRPIVRLTDSDGGTNAYGLFVVRASDAAKTIEDLADHRILFGPACDQERRSAAVTTLAEHGVAAVPPLQTVAGCRDAALAVAKGDVDAAVISDFALPFAENNELITEGTLRTVGRTAPVPFITAFATSRVGPTVERGIVDALLSVKENPQLLEALGSKAGFVGPDAKPAAQALPAHSPVAPSGEKIAPEGEGAAEARVPPSTTEWTDWRGPGRAGTSPDIPTKLPATAKLLWKRGLTGPGPAGVAATASHVIVADKSEQNDQDIWRCLDAETGKELWTVAYGTPKELQFTNAPRATPVIHGGFAYLLGAFGDLHCVSLHGHRIVWRRQIVEDFGAKRPPWGMCSTPLIVDDSLVVNPGAPDASLVALGLYTGEVLWKTPGEPAAPASLILGTLGGVRQIVGYDAASLGGWDPNTGQRLWTLLPDKKGDYNVVTPINVNGRLLVATENNGTRLYDFDETGRIRPIPVARNPKLAPDTSTPVVTESLVFGCSRGLFCLDLDNLKTQYSAESDEAFQDYVSLVAGNGHLLATTVRGELVLLKAARDGFTPVSRLQVFKGAEVWSHPALVGPRLYLRSMKEICCLLLDQ